MTPANWLTFSRLIISPIVFFLFFYGNGILRLFGLVLFSLGAISDFWDGYIARRTIMSHWGKLWDPIADKILSGFALITLSAIALLPWWITIALIFRDVVITTLRLIKLKQGEGIILPVLLAKLKTTLELIMLTALLAWAAIVDKPLTEPTPKIVVAYGAVVVLLSWTTAIHYIKIALQKRGN